MWLVTMTIGKYSDQGWQAVRVLETKKAADDFATLCGQMFQMAWDQSSKDYVEWIHPLTGFGFRLATDMEGSPHDVDGYGPQWRVEAVPMGNLDRETVAALQVCAETLDGEALTALLLKGGT